MLGQMFDQVIAKHLTEEKLLELVNRSRPAAQPQIASAEEARKIFGDDFVARMSANRAPMGAPPKATPTNQAENTGRLKSRMAWFISGSTRFVFGTAAISPR